eukprot:TRINITY_DN8073_c0_g1_i3.p2 TRINITY_DN8073_c0_g1~~TRINITY_DN8073_c0_g1_i3.p2  ORF type:complete len:107 (-),score=15.07 TRINITY_DN8073_c0_g1_i3:5-325(-)
MGQFQAWNECLPHLLNVVNAHIEQVLFQQFMAGVDACVDMECRRSLKTMADLFALSCIQNDMMFRDEDFIAPMKAKAISKMSERKRRSPNHCGLGCDGVVGLIEGP